MAGGYDTAGLKYLHHSPLYEDGLESALVRIDVRLGSEADVGAAYFTTNSFLTSSLNASPCPGRSGAVMKPSAICGGSTHKSSSSPMFSAQMPFGIEARRCTLSSGKRCGAIVSPQVSASVAILRKSVMPPRIGSGCRIGRHGLMKNGRRS